MGSRKQTRKDAETANIQDSAGFPEDAFRLAEDHQKGDEEMI